MASVYIETTIPSYYHETRTDADVVSWRLATRRWWDRYRSGYELFTSRGVRAELQKAPKNRARRLLTMIRRLPALEDAPEIEKIVGYYLEHHLMPMEAGVGDAYHLAMASFHSMDYLLTWNCRHLANANKSKHTAILNKRLRLHVQIITTPLSLIPEESP